MTLWRTLIFTVSTSTRGLDREGHVAIIHLMRNTLRCRAWGRAVVRPSPTKLLIQFSNPGLWVVEALSMRHYAIKRVLNSWTHHRIVWCELITEPEIQKNSYTSQRCIAHKTNFFYKPHLWRGCRSQKRLGNPVRWHPSSWFEVAYSASRIAMTTKWYQINVLEAARRTASCDHFLSDKNPDYF